MELYVIQVERIGFCLCFFVYVFFKEANRA